MLNINFNIANPYSDRFNNIWNRSGDTPISYKHWESQIYRSNDIISFGLRITHRTDHAGVYLSLALFTWALEFNIYDSRHWNHNDNKWYEYGDGSA